MLDFLGVDSSINVSLIGIWFGTLIDKEVSGVDNSEKKSVTRKIKRDRETPDLDEPL